MARSGSLGVVKQCNVKLQDALAKQHITELTVVNGDIELLAKKWKTLNILLEEK